jgi:hypothetical protein
VKPGRTIEHGALSPIRPRLGSSILEQGETAPAVVSGWVGLNAQVLDYQSVLRYLARLSTVALLISLFIGRRPEISILDPNEPP